MDVQLVEMRGLPLSPIARELVGADHGGVGICVIFVDAPPSEGPNLHKHPYEEIFITLDGEAAFVVDDQELHVGSGDIVIVPPHTAHAFTNSGTFRCARSTFT
jgi:mannose-6-phosphate isomerase-like protein (cupin superfamily)